MPACGFGPGPLQSAHGESSPQPSRDIAVLLEIMRRLRAPDGCPWDREQTFATIAPYTVEEAYEVAASIEDDDFKALPDELGDLLFQVVFHARMAEEQGLFDFGDVVEAVTAKMIRRHPHVFGGAKRAADAAGPETGLGSAQGRRTGPKGAIYRDGPRSWTMCPSPCPPCCAPKSCSAAPPASGLTGMMPPRWWKRSPRKPGKWPRPPDPAERSEEIGDLLFVVANLARHLKVDPEAALRAANAKFTRRFHFIESELRGRGPQRRRRQPG